MLSKFFLLNEPYKTFNEADFVEHFTSSCDLRCVLYAPDKIPTNKYKDLSFTNVSFSKTVFSKVTFTDCTFEDCLFVGAQFVDSEFHRCKFINCNFHKLEVERCYLDPKSLSFHKRYRREAANIGVHVYHQLFENSSKTRQSDYEMSADFEFRRWKRWQLAYDRKAGKISALEFASKRVSSLSYELLTGFGYSPSRFILATIIFFLAMSSINMNVLAASLSRDGQLICDMTFADAVFYTYSMMTALGFSTIVPTTNFAKILTVAEALMGIGWLGIFTFLLVNRFIK